MISDEERGRTSARVRDAVARAIFEINEAADLIHSIEDPLPYDGMDYACVRYAWHCLAEAVSALDKVEASPEEMWRDSAGPEAESGDGCAEGARPCAHAQLSLESIRAEMCALADMVDSCDDTKGRGGAARLAQLLEAMEGAMLDFEAYDEEHGTLEGLEWKEGVRRARTTC